MATCAWAGAASLSSRVCRVAAVARAVDRIKRIGIVLPLAAGRVGVAQHVPKSAYLEEMNCHESGE